MIKQFSSRSTLSSVLSVFGKIFWQDHFDGIRINDWVSPPIFSSVFAQAKSFSIDLIHVVLVMYADDTTIYYSSSSMDDINTAINAGHEALRGWLEGNKLSLNVVKTQGMIMEAGASFVV